MKATDEQTIAGGATAAADEVSAIIEPFEELRNALRRLSSTQIAGSDELVRVLNQKGAPQLYKMAGDFRSERRLKKLRSLAANCRPALKQMVEALAVMEKAMGGE